MRLATHRVLPDSWQGGSVAATARRHRARRVLAALLVAIAALAVVQRITSSGATRAIVVAAHDLSAGQRLTSADLRSVAWPARVPLPGPLSTDQAVGAVVDAPMRAGEPLTTARIRAARTWAGSGTRVVSVPVEPALASVLTRGDRVDVYAGGRLVAAGTTVVQTSGAASTTAWTEQEDPRVLLSVNETDAAAVAAGGNDSGDGRLTLALHPAA